MKPIFWTKHAVNEASKFRLDQPYCEQIIRDPDKVLIEGSEKRRYIRFKKKKMIMVICIETEYMILIKTIDITTRRKI
ncbi:MAG: hypothetical protein ACE5KE_10695 [Methanosarcinales archaeon]